MAAGLSHVRLEIAPKRYDIQYTVRVDFVAGVHRRSWIHKDRGGGRANGERVW